MYGIINVMYLLINTIKLKCLIILLLIPISSFADNRPGFVCGKFNGHVIEVPSNYIDIYSFAEYDGYSAWDPRFIHNKKGCDANFTSLPIIANWPDMGPVDQVRHGKDEFDKLDIHVLPIRNQYTDFIHTRNFYLEEEKNKKIEPIIYHPALDLFSAKVTKKLDRKNWSRSDPTWFDEDINNYYWTEIEGRIPIFIDCHWLVLKKRYSNCKIEFTMLEIDAFVNVTFSPGKLSQWQEIRSKTEEFILSKIIN